MLFWRRRKTDERSATATEPTRQSAAPGPIEKAKNVAAAAADAPRAPSPPPAAPQPAFDGPHHRKTCEDPLEQQIVCAMKTVFDPEIPIDVYELGLIYNVDIGPEKNVAIEMTLTSPNCPSAEQIPGDVEKKVRAIEGVKDVKVAVVWLPPWDKDMMSDAAKLTLGFDD